MTSGDKGLKEKNSGRGDFWEIKGSTCSQQVSRENPLLLSLVFFLVLSLLQTCLVPWDINYFTLTDLCMPLWLCVSYCHCPLKIMTIACSSFLLNGMGGWLKSPTMDFLSYQQISIWDLVHCVHENLIFAKVFP